MFAIAKTIPHRRLSIALASAVLTGAAGWFFLCHLENSYRDTAERVPVLTASRYIPRDIPLRTRFFRRTFIPKAYISPEAIADYAVLESSGHPLWRNRVAIPEGAQLAQRDLAALAQADTLSQHIGENEVAVSFDVDPTRAIAGMLQPGDLIDILHTPKPKELDSAFRSTTPLFQSVRIVAVGKQWAAEKSELTPRDGEDTLILTVLLNPLAALRLAEARENETLSVMLRGL